MSTRTKCPDCFAAIFWLREASVGIVAVDAKPSSEGTVTMDSIGFGGSVLTDDILERARTEGRALHTSHQATCTGPRARR